MRKKSLAETHPFLAKQWHRTKNGDRTPDRFRPSRPYGLRQADPDMARRASLAFPRCGLMESLVKCSFGSRCDDKRYILWAGASVTGPMGAEAAAHGRVEKTVEPKRRSNRKE